AVSPNQIKQGPAIERRAGVRDPESDQVPDLELTVLRYSHDGVLVVESNDGTIGQDAGFAITVRPAPCDRLRKIDVGADVALAHGADRAAAAIAPLTRSRALVVAESGISPKPASG